MTVNINDLTLGQVKEIASMTRPTGTDKEFPISAAVIIQTVTMIYSGIVEDETSGFVTLTAAAWIADIGRFADALKSGEFSEVEPFGATRCNVAKGAIVSWWAWPHKLPTEQK